MKAIVFDFGNSLAAFDSFETGLLDQWPVGTLVFENAAATFKALSREYRLFVATSAQGPHIEKVITALERTNLLPYFEKVFTLGEQGRTHGSPEFYREMLADMRLLPDQVLMVGDQYHQDILLPTLLGFRTCYFNPKYWGDVNGVYPVHSMEVFRLEDLPGRLKQGLLPSINECLLWLVENNASYGILQHVQTVAVIAYDLAVRLASSGQIIDPVLAHRGGLLHDIDKLHPDSSQVMHGKIGAGILREKGFEDIAAIVERHTISPDWEPDEIPETWEQKIVFYADKLVRGHEVVSLEERLADLIRRYPVSQGIFEKNSGNLSALENLIMTAIHFTPPDYLLTIQQKLHGAKRLPGSKS